MNNLLIKLLFFCLMLFGTSSTYCFEMNAPVNQTDGTQDTNQLNLTDEDRVTSQTFFHDGLAQRTYDEECKKAGGTDVCDGTKKEKICGLDEDMFEMLPKAYSMIVGTVGGGFNVPKEDQNGKRIEKPIPNDAPEGTKAEYETEEQTDYCAVIPMLGEILSMSNHDATSDTLKAAQEQSKNKQADALYNTAKEHDNRAKTADMQSTTWGLGAACYIGYATVGGVTDTSLYLKLGGSALLAKCFADIAKKNKDRAKILRKIAKKLPGVGDCNPITDNACYCAQKETMNDAKHCLPQIAERNIHTYNGVIATCVDSNMKSDPACKCNKSNSCYDQTFLGDISNLSFGNDFANSASGIQFRDLTKGKVGSAKMSGATTAMNAIKKLDLSSLASPENPLSKSQNKLAQALNKLGLPPLIAAHLSAAPSSKSSGKYASRFNRLRGTGRYSSNKRYKKRGRKSKVFSYSKPSRKSSRKSRKSFNVNSYLKKKKKRKSRSKVLKFAQRAQRQGQINQDTSKPIFEIISRRYKISAWKKLEWE